MRKLPLVAIVATLSLVLVAACTSSSLTGSRTSSTQTLRGGTETLKAKKANGSSTVDIEIENNAGPTLQARVTVYAETGSFKVELLGDDDFITAVIEARDGQTSSGEGFMTVDLFDEASYRWTAVEATNVEMHMEYVFELD
jgi:hypothetical protein